MKVINNFLTKEEHKKLEKDIMGPFFPWYYNDIVVYKNDPLGHFQFIHLFYENNSLNKSNLFEMLRPIIDKIKPLSVLRIKANLSSRTDKIIEHSFHTDFENDDRITTGIFYVNTNNGYTKFKNNKLQKSVANKFIEFNSTENHAGTSCTDENVRVVINFNYIK